MSVAGAPAAPQHALTGAYVTLDALLTLRHRRPPRGREPPNSRTQIAGQRLSKMRGRGIDFAEVRLYQPGDDIRTIDWRVTARKNKPHTKVFREERERPTLLVVDQSQAMFFGSQVRLKSVAAAEVAALAAWHSLGNNDRVGGLVIGNQRAPSHKPLRTVKAVARLLGDIAAENQALDRHSGPCDRAHLADALFSLRRMVRTNYRVLLVSDFRTHPDLWFEAITQVGRHNEVIAVRISDPLEQQLPPADRYTVTDGSTRWQFHSGDNSLRDRYRARFAEQEDHLKQLCNAYGARFFDRATNGSAELGIWS